MQEAELFNNIKEARAQLSKLKNEAQILSSDPFGSLNQNSNMNQYIKSVAYSLTKNQQSIQKKLVEYGDEKNREKIERNRLPSINKNREHKSEHDISLGEAKSAYRKHRKNYKHVSQHRKEKTDEQSTKIDNSFTLSIQNRPMKIHSNYEKGLKPEISIQKQVIPLQIPPEIAKLKEQTFRIENQNRSRGVRNKSFHNIANRRNNQIKYLDLNTSSQLRETDELLAPNEMEYGEIVDKYSKHEFMIINGKFISEGPEYASFSRIYGSILTKIRIEISKLESMLKEKNIKYAKFDGKKLAFLCLKDQVSKSELVDCIIDENNQIKNILFPAKKFLGLVGQVFAVTKIQSFFRMSETRAKYLLLKSKTKIIQTFFRKNLQKLELERKIQERNTKIINDFEERQQVFQDEWKNIRKGKRIEIHINNMEIDEEKRLSIENFGERENIQLSRIFRLKDVNLIIIYVSSRELPPEVINYYYKMLELANIHKYQDRLIFMTPSEAYKFPEHFSVSKLLYYSSKTLKQLRIITEDLPTILFPGQPSNQLIKICDYLKCYLFSGSPQQIKAFTTKSQSIRFLKNLSLLTLPSAMQMYDYGQFLNTFAVLITKNPQIKTWILKIDDEFGGRGIAYLEVGRSKLVQNYLKKLEFDENDQFFPTDAGGSEPTNQEVTIKIRDYLKDNLAERLRIATPTLYRCYEEFMGKFIKKGGIIEAKPPYSDTKGTYFFPSVSFCLNPNGQYDIITTYEKLIGSPYRAYACSFPQKCIQLKQVTPIITRICESFKLRKIFGHFTLDFIYYKQNQGASKKNFERLWIIDIDPYINNYTSSFYTFDVLMAGTYFPEQNSYLVEEQDNDKSDVISIETMSSDGMQSAPLSERSYIFIPHFHNSNLFKIKIKQFFKQARIEKFNFDIANKQGLCVMLLDQLTSGIMSMMGIGRYQEQQIDLLRRVMEFVVKITEIKNVAYGGTQVQPTTDRIPVKDIMSLFTSLVRKRDREGAKEKAIKKFKNNCDLAFIS